MAALLVPLHIVVRFSTSNPDVVLTVAIPRATTGASLKQLIRAQLDAPASESKLRLIHAGKVLLDNAALSTSIHVTRPPPTRDDDAKKSEKAKGKLPDRDAKPAALRVYIHCSIGDTLTPAELAAEVQAAEDADKALLSTTAATPAQDGGAEGETTTTSAPIGFDRLLTAGFTATEVATLRAQFLAIQSHSHTPDTMPSGPELLALEESWLDNGSTPSTDADGTPGGFGEDDPGGLEDMLWGNMIGFFWPIGAMGFLMREEGVWSRRKQIAVLSGFVINLTFGLLKMLN
ncbi:hypothetical protein LTR56_021397 [Elasticomyces elasticus]|nr:hypothetical protein LTR22_026460 [Elasticomyces elasticus]KAK3623744.1 hypothetical protein LTR56_021397 [Elasticomyces elasticus]KAK4898116.1 hypothetical protein LTR49_027864 [Elasticomyces elasticus]KAK5754311.1 hypothetical protein LTS12_015602 [Elasticomyces elasticus]